MTRRMELGDLPVIWAASLTVRNGAMVGWGSGCGSISQGTVMATAMIGDTRRPFRQPVGRIAVGVFLASKLIPVGTKEMMAARRLEIEQDIADTVSETWIDSDSYTFQDGIPTCFRNDFGVVSPLFTAFGRG